MLDELFSRAGIQSEFDRVYILSENDTILHAFDSEMVGHNAYQDIPLQDHEQFRTFVEDIRSQQQSVTYFDDRHTQGINLGKRIMIFVTKMSAHFTRASLFILFVLTTFDYLNIGIT